MADGPLSRVERWAWRLLAAVASIALAILFVPFFVSFPTLEVQASDWAQMNFYWEAPRQTLLRWGQIPLWNPFYCGGNVLMAHPHSQFVTPFFLLSLPFGTRIAYRIAVVGYLVIGFWGMITLTARMGLEPAARLYAALSFAFMGFFAWGLASGHFWILGFQLLPWVYLAYLAAVDAGDRRRALVRATAGGAIVAAMVFHAGFYAVPFSMLALSLDGLLRSGARLRGRAAAWSRPLGVVAVTGLTGFLLSGPKSFPLVQFARTHGRVFTDRDDALVWTDLLRNHFGRNLWRTWDMDGGRFQFQWWEYGNDVSLLLLPLAVFGAWMAWRKAWIPLALAGAFLLLVLGDHGPWSPYGLIRRLPVFEGLHVPTRYSVMVVFFLSLAAAFGLDAGLRDLRTRGRRWAGALGWAVAVSAMLDPFALNALVGGLWTYGRLDLPPAEATFIQRPGNRATMQQYAAAGVGSVECYEASKLRLASGLRTGDVPQAWSAPWTRGEVRQLDWSPNRIVLEADFESSGRVVVNQNHYPGWRTSAGRVVPHEGLIAVDLPAGHHVVRLRFLPLSFVLGSVAAVLTVLAWLWMGLRFRTAPRAGPPEAPSLRTPEAEAPASPP